jgi:hypothetical protein
MFATIQSKRLRLVFMRKVKTCLFLTARKETVHEECGLLNKTVVHTNTQRKEAELG